MSTTITVDHEWFIPLLNSYLVRVVSVVLALGGAAHVVLGRIDYLPMGANLCVLRKLGSVRARVVDQIDGIGIIGVLTYSYSTVRTITGLRCLQVMVKGSLSHMIVGSI